MSIAPFPLFSLRLINPPPASPSAALRGGLLGREAVFKGYPFAQVFYIKAISEAPEGHNKGRPWGR